MICSTRNIKVVVALVAVGLLCSVKATYQATDAEHLAHYCKEESPRYRMQEESPRSIYERRQKGELQYVLYGGLPFEIEYFDLSLRGDPEKKPEGFQGTVRKGFQCIGEGFDISLKLAAKLAYDINVDPKNDLYDFIGRSGKTPKNMPKIIQYYNVDECNGDISVNIHVEDKQTLLFTPLEKKVFVGHEYDSRLSRYKKQGIENGRTGVVTAKNRNFSTVILDNGNILRNVKNNHLKSEAEWKSIQSTKPTMTTCQKCKGKGKTGMFSKSTCKTCNGVGKVKVNRRRLLPMERLMQEIERAQTS